MKKYTTPKTLLLCLILVSLLFAACKDKGNEEVKQQDNKTVLEGTWVYSAPADPSAPAITITSTLTCTGANFSSVTIMQDTAYPNPSDPTDSTIAGTETVTMTMTGTFKLNNNQMLVTPKTATDICVNTVDSSRAYSRQGNAALTSTNGYQIDHEKLMGTYTVNGTVLTMTPDGSPGSQEYHKQ